MKGRQTNRASTAAEGRNVAAQRLRDVQASGYEDVINLEKLCQVLRTGTSYKNQADPKSVHNREYSVARRQTRHLRGHGHYIAATSVWCAFNRRDPQRHQGGSGV